MLIDDRNTFYNLREGVKELEKSIQLGKEPRYPGDTKQPEFVAAHIKLAGLYLNKNYEVYNVELAEQHLKEALGDIQHRLQKKYTRKTERDISSLESIYLNLGKCALEKDDPQTAKEFFTKCIQESQSGEMCKYKEHDRPLFIKSYINIAFEKFFKNMETSDYII